MEKVLFSQVQIQDPQSAHHEQVVDVLVVNGIIQKIAEAGSLSGEGATLCAQEGSMVSPGWMDMETQLCEPGHEYKESLVQLAEAGRMGGFTALLGFPNTSPVVDNAQATHSILTQAKPLPIHFWLTGAVSEKREGRELAELYDMHRAGVKAFSDGSHPLPSAGIFLRALQYMRIFDGLLIHTSLDPSLVGEGQMNEGIESTQLGMEGIPEMAETIPAQRDLDLLAYSPGRIHFQAISSPKAVEILWKGKKDLSQLTLGTNLPYLLLNDQALRSFDANLKLIPPLRSAEAQTALLAHLKAGHFDVLATGHQAQGIEEKRLEFALAEPGMLGLQTFYPLVQSQLINAGYLTITDFVRMLSIRPREILGLEVPVVEVGATADLSWFHPTQSWTLSPDMIPSRAKNSPWIGQELKGKALGIYVKGAFHACTLSELQA